MAAQTTRWARAAAPACGGIVTRMVQLDPGDWLPSHADYVRIRTEYENERGIRWTEEFSEVVRRKLAALSEDVIEEAHGGYLSGELDEKVLALIRRHSRIPPRADTLAEALTNPYVTVAEIADWLAAIPIALAAIDRKWSAQGMVDSAGELLSDLEPYFTGANDVLLEERVGWLYLHDRLRRRESQPLHVDVVQPLEALLSADPRFDAAERAYGEATNNLAQGNYGSAVSLTYSAVQEALQSLGAKGNDLSALFASAKDSGFLSNADSQLLQAIKNLLSWLTANRSARGNAHGASSATRADAQLALNTAASLMLRLMQFPSTET